MHACLLLACLLLACCQKVDLAVEPDDDVTADNSEQAASVIGTGEGTRQCPYTVTDIRATELSAGEAVWVIGYMVGTARLTMNNAVFSADADNQSNILLSSDSRCTDMLGREIKNLHHVFVNSSLSAVSITEGYVDKVCVSCFLYVFTDCRNKPQSII